MTAWRAAWRIAALEIPLPDDRARPDETDEAGRWQRTFDTAAATEEAARIWDGWASDAGLRVVQSLGPHALGLSRIYGRDDLTVTIQLCRMPGEIAQVVVHVERPDDLPRAVIVDGVVAAHGLTVPVPPGARPGAHDDLTDVGGEDVHEVVAAGLDLQAFLAIYLAWARRLGLELAERIDGAERCALVLRRRGGGTVTVTWLSSAAAGGEPIVRLAFSANDGTPS